jgi:two-component system, sensor histidine kinase RegB
MQIRLDSSPEQNLRSLCALRGCALFGLVAWVIAAHYGLGSPPALPPILGVILALLAWTALTLLRLLKPWAVTQFELVIHLAVDAGVLTILFALSGGPANPFISFYLVPIAIAAVMLTRVWAWLVTLLCMGLYTWLMVDYTQHLQHHAAAHDFHLHVFGMWLNFLLSAILVAVFVTAIAAAVRSRDRSLAAARETQLRNEQILAMGTLAAGAAHELSTPLSTMAITVSEMKHQHQDNPGLAADLGVLSEQITICRQQLDVLLSRAGRARADPAGTLSLRSYLNEIIERARLIRPETRFDVGYRPDYVDAAVHADATFSQAVLAALNNAADASATQDAPRVGITIGLLSNRLLIEIRDYGRGLDPAQRAQVGRVVFSTKPEGYGLGLLLSHATLDRLGGEIEIVPTDDGSLTRIVLPLASLAPAG